MKGRKILAPALAKAKRELTVKVDIPLFAIIDGLGFEIRKSAKKAKPKARRRRRKVKQ